MSSNANSVKWILDHADQLNLTVEAYKWNLPFDTNILDCKVGITVNGQRRIGRGSANTEELALLKAFSEAVDRVAFFETKRFSNTNGIAVHSSLALAIQSARCELMERDSFLCHHLTATPFIKPSIDLNSLGFDSQIFDFLDTYGVHYQIAEMQSSMAAYTYIFMIHGLEAKKKLGFMCGLGCNSDQSEAARSAVYEGLRHVIANISAENLKMASEEEFFSKATWGPFEHMALSNNLSFSKKIESQYWNLSPRSPVQKSLIRMADIPYEQLPLTGELSDSPFFAVKAISDRLQNLYFGPTKQENVNLLRLSEFTGKSFTWDMINKIPHPLA